MPSELQKLWKTEDYRAVWLGLGIVLLGFFLSTVVFSRYWSNISALM